ncbi:hypothetical protein OsJ_14678 [Oryza sativa Japonica Group]|uniref:Uncharacterized protein n=1 Tax=Oryza sativa subsp. japonica TaxID=39947 RepID=B9FF01_ORYSJ|nr:hypothetical protein OsJ_14678 [Oryza sativa Japonica Group]
MAAGMEVAARLATEAGSGGEAGIGGRIQALDFATDLAPTASPGRLGAVAAASGGRDGSGELGDGVGVAALAVTAAEAAPPLKERDANKKREKATGSAQVVNAESAVAVAAAGGEGDQKRKVPMPENFVAMILALKREPWPTFEYLDSLSPEKRSEELKSAERRSKLDDDLEKLQKDVRDGIDKDGYYLVDESYLAESAACEAQIDELWAKIDWDLYNFGDWDYDDPEYVVYL